MSTGITIVKSRGSKKSNNSNKHGTQHGRSGNKSTELSGRESEQVGDSSQEQCSPSHTRGIDTENQSTSEDAEATASALPPEGSTAPRRSARSTRGNNCVKCTYLVRKTDDGLQCDFCGKWEHLECSPVGVRLHSYLQDSRVDQVLYICSACHLLRKCGINPTLMELKERVPPNRHEHTTAAPQSPNVWRTLRSRIINCQTPDGSINRTEKEGSDSSSGDDSDVTVIAVETRQTNGTGGTSKNKKPKKKAKVRAATISTTLPATEPTSEEECLDDWKTVSRKRKGRGQDSSDKQVDPVPLQTNGPTGFPPRENCVMLFRLPESEDPSPSVR